MQGDAIASKKESRHLIWFWSFRINCVTQFVLQVKQTNLYTLMKYLGGWSIVLSQWMRRGVCLLFVCSKKNLNFICFYILSVYSFVFWMMSDIQTSTLHCISTNIFVKSTDYIHSNDKIYLLKVQIIFVQMTNNSWCGRQTALCLLYSGLVSAS